MDAAAPIETLAALADIEIPAPPAPATPLLALSVLILILAAAALWLLLSRRRKPPQTPTPHPSTLADEALRRLDALHEEWRAGKTEDRETAYRLCALLRIGMTLHRLDPALPPACAPAAEWSACLHALRRPRYSAHGGAIDAAVFESIRHWLAAHRTGTEAAHV